jgi:hypothetical protein
LTKLFHLATLHELYKSSLLKETEISKVVPEQTVLLEPLRGNSIRKGRFDFLVLDKNGKTIGIEVLSRPSQGKMKQKLSYAKEVDEFVFVLPTHSFELYRKKPRNGFKLQGRKRFFSTAFSASTLQAWLVDPSNGTIVEKGRFSQLFNAKQ